MSSHNVAAAVDQTNRSSQMNNVYIYRGGKVVRQEVEHVCVDESVSVVDDDVFAYYYNLRKVDFPTNHNTLKQIGNGSFRGCKRLSSINLQYTQVETIGNLAFSKCKGLATIQFPSSIRQIGTGCFAWCHQLNNIDLSLATNLKTLDERTFFECNALKTINLPPTLSCIGNESFSWCKALESIDLRETCIAEIGKRVFVHCTNLTTIYFPTTLKYIGTDCFKDCKKLESLDLQTTLIKQIGSCTFNECSNLMTIKFPMTLHHIGRSSFAFCSNLKHLNLEETSIEKIGYGAFMCCKNLTTIVGIIPTRDDEIVPPYDNGGSFMKLPATLMNIGAYCFYECPKLAKKFDSNWLHYQCDINCGGRRFLQRTHHEDNSSNHDGANKRRGKVYFCSLWPLILYRVLNTMEIPQHEICSENDDNLLLYTKATPLQRRASVVYYLLVHGVVADLQPSSSQSGKNEQQQTEKRKTSKRSSLSGLTKKRKQADL